MGSLLTPEQIKTIKAFPEKVLARVRSDLMHEPENKNNYKWIYNKCMFYKNNYKRSNFVTVTEREEYESDQREYERAKYPYRRYVPQEYISRPKAPEKKDLKFNEKFIALVGMDTFIKYSSNCGFIDPKKEDYPGK